MNPAPAAPVRRRALWVLTAVSAAVHVALLAPRPPVVTTADPSVAAPVRVVQVAASPQAVRRIESAPGAEAAARRVAPVPHQPATPAPAAQIATPPGPRTVHRDPVPVRAARQAPAPTEPARATALASADRAWREGAPESRRAAEPEVSRAPDTSTEATATTTLPAASTAPALDAEPRSIARTDAPVRVRPTLLPEVEAAPAAGAGMRIPAAAIPPSETLQYRLSRGAVSGSGELKWVLNGSNYQVRLDAKVPVFGTLLSQASQGQIDAYGLAPTRHTEKRIGRSERSVNFVRRPDGQGGQVAYSMRTDTDPFTAGAQDRVSWMPQLAAVLQAWPGPGGKGHGVPSVGTVIPMDIASTSGTLRRWQFRMLDVTPEGWLHLRREPEHEHDTRSEVWVDPQNHHWPLRVIMTDGNSEALELVLKRGD